MALLLNVGAISAWTPEERERKKREITEISNRDGIAIAIRTAFGGLPYIGPAITELVNVWIPNSSFQRLVDFSLDVSEAMTRLQPRIDPDYLKTEEGAFVLKSILDGIASSYQKEKLEVFRAFFLNSILKENGNQETKELYLRAVEDLTITHIKLLRLLDNPAEFLARRAKVGYSIPAANSTNAGSVLQVLQACLTELREAEISAVWVDLYNVGFVKGDANSIRGIGAYASWAVALDRLTPYGRDFVKFIKIP